MQTAKTERIWTNIVLRISFISYSFQFQKSSLIWLHTYFPDEIHNNRSLCEMRSIVGRTKCENSYKLNIFRCLRYFLSHNVRSHDILFQILFGCAKKPKKFISVQSLTCYESLGHHSKIPSSRKAYVV